MKQNDNFTNINIWGLISFILKTPIENEVKLIEKGSLLVNVEFAASKQKRFIYEKLDEVSKIDDMPDILFRGDFKGLVQPNLRKVVNDSKEYINILPQNLMGEEFRKIGFLDTKGIVTMIGAKPWIIVIDHSISNNIKVPNYWEDLLSKEYENKISIQGKEGRYCGTLLMYFYKEFGQEGLVRLANSVKNTGHFTDLIKAIGNGRKNTAPISIMPLVNAKLIPNRRNIEIIWPKDGALLTPIYMFVKKRRMEYLKEYINFFIGDRMTHILKEQYFLSALDSYKYGKLKWIGWDHLYSINVNLEEYKEGLNRIFEKNYKGGYYAS